MVVDDEKRIVRLVSDFLAKEGYAVLPAYDGRQALDIYFENANKVSLVILDVMMPGAGGFEVLREIRREHDVPVIMLTAKAEEGDQISGFANGADDYVTKPFSPSVLVARVKNLLKRRGVTDEAIDFGEWKFCPGACAVVAEGEERRLTPREHDLLMYFINNKGLTLSREKVLNAVWNYDYYGDARTVDTHVKQLRAKLGNSLSIETIRGFGYRFVAESKK
jgi:DNA-binding response OmpR family regulator